MWSMKQVQVIWIFWFMSLNPFPVGGFLKNAIKTFGESGGNNSQCNSAILHTLKAAEKGELWALKVLDANSKFTPGQFSAPLIFSGMYDECLSSSDPEGQYMGQYCLISGNYSKLEDEVSPLTDAGFQFDLFRIGICAPSVCSYKQVEELLNNVFRNFIHFRTEKISCSTKETKLPLTKLDYSFIIIMSIIMITAFISTSYDCYQIFFLRNDSPDPLYCSFSLYSNGKNLLRSKDLGQYGCLNGIKALSMFAIVYGHTAMMLLLGNTSNRAENMLGVATAKWVTFNNTHNITDTFFVMGAMLLVATFFREIKIKGGYDFPLAVLKRYLRLTPCYALLLLYEMTIRKYHIFGPLYPYLNEKEMDTCHKNWLMCLTYTQNYMSPIAKCLGHSWYLDVDMQLFLLSPIMLYPVLWWPKITAIVPIIIAITIASYELYVGIYYDLGPAVTFARTFDHLKHDHYLTHTRSAPWFLGIFLGFIFCRIVSKGKNFKIPKKTLWFCWTIFGGIFAICQIPLYFFGFDYEQPMSSITLAYRRLGWGLGIGWIIIACTTNHGGIFNKFLNWGPFSYLSKISYNAYLIHLPFMEIALSQARDAEFASLSEVWSLFILFSMGSVFIATLMSLFVEMPCSKLVSIGFRNVIIFPYPKKKKSVSQEVTQVAGEEKA